MPQVLEIALVVLLSLMLKSFVGLWSYSGYNTPPMYGDFEAQRHWMEITVNLPMREWYRNSSFNNLQYWGLDYPPLTAYVSALFGKIALFVYPPLVTLSKSMGIENEYVKAYMRSTVIISDICVFIPALLLCYYKLNKQSSTSSSTVVLKPKMRLYMLLICMIQFPLVLIDHGHFQYNSVCIGFTVIGGVAILYDYDYVGSIMFALALNFKQMTLYYAPVFFIALIRKCAMKNTPVAKVTHFFCIGITVVLTFAILWIPFCVSSYSTYSCADTLLTILSRCFPFNRGVFEDKVGNIWFALSVIYDYRPLVTVSQMKLATTVLTLILICPVCWDLYRRPLTPVRLILSLVNCSLSFFLASFQVCTYMYIYLLIYVYAR